jgi:hypothetical protein
MSTYTPIATQTLGSAAGSVTFSSIPQGYTDLVVVCVPKGSASGSMRMQFNADTGSNYSSTQLSANTGAGTAVSARFSNVSDIRIGYYQSGMSTTDFLPCIIQLQNYSNGTTFKTALGRSAQQSVATVGLWRNTNAVSTITLFEDGGNIQSGSTFSIYGIQVGNAAQKAQGGNIVTTDGTYVYHTFTSSGSFTPSQALTADYLVVAGGGGGGAQFGGGGGAGGLRSTVTATGGGGSLESALSLSAGKSYPVIVGAGGAGSTATSARGSNGSNSVFSTITSDGGGGGGSNGSGVLTGAVGGSGGGGNGINSAGAAGTANQGRAGGNGIDHSGSNACGGGGGGASVAGQTSPVNFGGAGGAGVAVSITGSSVTYAGGGGGGAGDLSTAGGAGGAGGGGAGTKTGAATSGTANLGGGGGGSPQSTLVAGAGGSGIVIIRYAI